MSKSSRYHGRQRAVFQRLRQRNKFKPIPRDQFIARLKQAGKRPDNGEQDREIEDLPQ